MPAHRLFSADYERESQSLRLPRSAGEAGYGGELPRPEDVLDIEKIKAKGYFHEANAPAC
jgi:hypothetical protein